MMKYARVFAVCLATSALLLGLAGCNAVKEPFRRPEPLSTVQRLDLDAYMGDWFVIAHTPGTLDRNAYNAWQRYALDADGSILIDYYLRRGDFAGEQVLLQPRAFVRHAGSLAEWDVRYVWPLENKYWVLYVSPGYDLAVVGNPSRSFAMILSRTPEIAPNVYSDLALFLQQRGFDISLLRKVPQQWE